MASVEDRLAALETMAAPELRTLWVKLRGTTAPPISAGMLRLALAWEIQASVHGRLSRATQQRLAQHGRGKTRTSAAKPGMRLVREWNGHVHVVTLGSDGVVHWNERQWRSLSEVAREITGTRWSGPAFFGLKKRVAA